MPALTEKGRQFYRDHGLDIRTHDDLPDVSSIRALALAEFSRIYRESGATDAPPEVEARATTVPVCAWSWDSLNFELRDMRRLRVRVAGGEWSVLHDLTDAKWWAERECPV